MFQVCDRMGVSSDHIKQSKSNAKLLAGSRRLGYHADPIPVSDMLSSLLLVLIAAKYKRQRALLWILLIRL
jgi:hypothetical protein